MATGSRWQDAPRALASMALASMVTGSRRQDALSLQASSDHRPPALDALSSWALGDHRPRALDEQRSRALVSIATG